MSVDLLSAKRMKALPGTAQFSVRWSNRKSYKEQAFWRPGTGATEEFSGAKL